MNEIVAEGVPHQIRKVVDSRIEDDLAHVFIFNLLLKEAASTLVFGQLHSVGHQETHVLLRETLISLHGLTSRPQIEFLDNLSELLGLIDGQ